MAGTDARTPAEQIPSGMRDWSTWTREELERQYSPSRWSPYMPASRIVEQYVTTATADLALCRGRLEWTTRSVPKLDAGDSDIVMDVYGEALPPGSPVLVYVHGGYWQELSKDLVGGLMGPLCDGGVVVVVLEYTIAPPGRVEDMVREVCRGVRAAHHLAQSSGWGSTILAGWSAGAQLVLQALLQLDSGLPADASKSLVSWIRGVVTVSGVFLLTPLVDTYVNTALQLTRSDAWQLSPLNPDNCSRLRGLRGLAEHDLNFLIAVADHDSPSFKEQSRAYAEMLRRAGWGSVAELSVSRSDHMKIVADLSDASNSFSQNLLKFIKQCNSH